MNRGSASLLPVGVPPADCTSALTCRGARPRPGVGFLRPLAVSQYVDYSRHIVEVFTTDDFDRWLRKLKDRLAWGWGGQYLYVIPSLDLVFSTTHNTHEAHDTVEVDADAFVEDVLVPAVQTGHG